MRGLVNDFLRSLISLSIKIQGPVSTALLRLRMFGFKINQKRLKRKYGITRDTPVLPYGPGHMKSIRKAAARAGKNALFAETSGSTGKSKQIFYTKSRLFGLRLLFSDVFLRMCYTFRLKRNCLYVLNSFEPDASLTSLLLNERALPNYISTLQAPYRVHHHPAIRALFSKYGSAAVRLWLLTIANPGVLYSTNPSTLSTFLDEVTGDWQRASQLVKDWCEDPASFSSETHGIARRLESRGCAKRLKRIAKSDGPMPLSVCAPAVEAYICWTGGYVKPFLDRLATHLPSPPYKLIPMYSMSTETVETIPYFKPDDIAFLPIAGGVVYEFIEEGAMDHVDNLVNADELEPGKLYTMVVSDNYGLQRYQTGDLFLCRRMIEGLPDLVFVRRRGLEYSFTGEKLTGEQLSVVFETLRTLYPEFLGERFLTCVPSQPLQGLPHYKLLLVGNPCNRFSIPGDLLANRCEELLFEMNCEYRSKRGSGRLGPMRFMEIEIAEFAKRLAENGNWESQFKFLPLCRRTWESTDGKRAYFSTWNRSSMSRKNTARRASWTCS